MDRPPQLSVAGLLIAIGCFALALSAIAQMPVADKRLQLFLCLPAITVGVTGGIGALLGRFWSFALCGILLPLVIVLLLAIAFPMVL